VKKKFPGAQEGLEQGGHPFGITTFKAAYPQVIALEVEVLASPVGFGESETFDYCLHSPPGQYTPCPNPNCSGGGFHIGLFLGDLIHRRAAEGETRGGCVGRERMGRGNSRRCLYNFVAKAKIEYTASFTDPESEGPV
jgi:hypothetical protein